MVLNKGMKKRSKTTAAPGRTKSALHANRVARDAAKAARLRGMDIVR